MKKCSCVQRLLQRLSRRLPPAARLLFCRQLSTPLVRRLHWLPVISCAGQLLFFSVELAQNVIQWKSLYHQGAELPFPGCAALWRQSGAALWAWPLLLLPLGLVFWSLWEQRYPIRSRDTLRRLPCGRGQLWMGVWLLPLVWLAVNAAAQLLTMLLCAALWQWFAPIKQAGFF